MGINRIIELLECEKECCKRITNNNGENCCNCSCDECDFYIDEQEAITAYILAIGILKTIQGDRKVMNTTNHVAGGYNEFTIL